MSKEQVYVDVIISEDDTAIYFLGALDKKGQLVPANCCRGSGYFTDLDALDDFLDEHKEEISVEEDYRE